MTDGDIVWALSLTRPWDELILLGLKPVENRKWGTRHRGPLIVHAAKSWDQAAVDLARRLLGDEIADSLGTKASAPVGYRGVVTLRDVCAGHPCSCGPWAFPGQKHWKVTDPRRLHRRIPGGGRLSLFEPPIDVQRAARAALASEAPRPIPPGLLHAEIRRTTL